MVRKQVIINRNDHMLQGYVKIVDDNVVGGDIGAQVMDVA